MVFMFEFEVPVEFLVIDIIVFHDLEEFLKLFDEGVIFSRFLEFGFGKRIRRIHWPQQLPSFAKTI